MNCLRKLWKDEAGVIIAAELVLILTIVVIGVIVGLVGLKNAVSGELQDVSAALSSLNQSYGYTGFRGGVGRSCKKFTSFTAGSTYIDANVGEGGSVSDFGAYTNGGVFFGLEGVAVARVASYGTICLSDGTYIPLTWVASGTWSCPGGTQFAAISAYANSLRLGDGTVIPFLFGRAGTIVYTDGTIAVVRPGFNHTLVLANGAIAVLDPLDTTIAVLTDGVRVTFRPLDPNFVLLADGTTVEARIGEPGTLVLTNGRVLKLTDAILPPGMEVAPLDGRLGCPTEAPCEGSPSALPLTPQPESTLVPQKTVEPEKVIPAEPEKTKKTKKKKNKTVMLLSPELVSHG